MRISDLSSDVCSSDLRFQDPVAEVANTIWSSDESTLIGVGTATRDTKGTLVNEAHPDAQLYASLAESFPGQMVYFSSHTDDGKLIVVSVYSDTNPGELYLYDRDTGKARFLMQGRKWLDKDAMASTKPFTFTSRDGKRIHGYLTIPHG